MLIIKSVAPHPLYDVASTRRLEASATADLPPHALMQRAGLASARLALAIAPHAGTIWVACGPGNNGGDGFVAARLLKEHGFGVTVGLLGDQAALKGDAAAMAARWSGGVARDDEMDLHDVDLIVDALFGAGLSRPLEGKAAKMIERLNERALDVVAVDVSGK